MMSEVYDTWRKKAVSELKGKDISSLDWKINERITLSPIYFDSPRTGYDGIEHEDSPWYSGEVFAHTEDEYLNQLILKGLDQGINSPKVVIDSNCDISKVLADVMREHVNIVLQPKDSVVLDHCISFMDPIRDANTQIWVGEDMLIETDIDTAHVHRLFKEDMLIETDFDRSISGLFTKVIDHLENDSANRSHHTVLQIILGSQFHLSVAKIMAVRLLWKNLVQATGISSTLFLDVVMLDKMDDVGPEQQIIDSTTQCMAAVFGGADRVTLPNLLQRDWNNAAYYHQITRNIHSILTLESHLHEYRNMVDGSFYFENIAMQLAEEIWTQIISNIN